MDDLPLVEASRTGDRGAFGSLIDRYYQSVYRLAYQYTGSHHDADDVCQEAFLRAFDAIESLRDGARFKGWIFTIASNLVRERAKKMQFEKKLAVKGSGVGAVGPSANADCEPLRKLSAQERTSVVRLKVREMPEDIRLVAILILMEGLSQKDAAAVLSCSEATVCRRLEAARAWLSARLRSLI